MSQDAFDLLQDIEQKCKKHMRPLPMQKEVGKTWAGIGFQCADTYFVTPLSEIKEVLTIPAVTNIPSSADWFQGMANLRGHILPITDLQGFVLDKIHKPTSLSRVLVCDFEETGVGFVVQQVIGVQHFMEKNLKPIVEENVNAQFQPFLKGEFLENNQRWHILSLKFLSESAQFYHVVKEAGA